MFNSKIYTIISRCILCNKLSLFSEIVILLASGYLLVKKAFNVSLSTWFLENNLLNHTGVNVYLYSSGILLSVAIIIKAISLFVVNFPANKQSNVEPDNITECLQVVNNEIISHIKKCDSDTLPNIRKLCEQHSFDVNIRLIVDSLAEHIKKSVMIQNRDLLITLYTYDESSKQLKYELHYDPKRDLIKTKIINLQGKDFASYECVKCMNSPDSTAYADKDTYAKTIHKRHKSFKQYMGCKLEANGWVFGFLNIEFHNHSIFVDESKMQDFMEENVFPFKLLIEYQYLKGRFFNRFEELEKHWEGVK